jgi:hypothetical protein
MRKTMRNDRQSGHEGFGYMAWRVGAATLLFLGLCLFHSTPADALPKGGTCKGTVPDGAFTCESNGGLVWCDNDGVYMCCVKNSQGGYDCEQIEAKTTTPLGGIRVPGGKLQMAPGTTSPSTSTSPKAGMTAPTSPMIRRRGVEGEQPSETAPGTSVPPEQTVPEQPSGTKPQ